MTTLIKLGGSLVTDKRQPKAFRRETVRSIARQLTEIHKRQPKLGIVLGHGSGSFGHFEARKYDADAGVRSAQDRLAFARVGAAASQLSQLILDELLAASLPALRFQPSAMQIARDRSLAQIRLDPLRMALEKGYLPLAHGDIALDETIGGCIISTEALFARLVRPLNARRIILLGNVEGVLDRDGAVIPHITPRNIGRYSGALGASEGYDVTGGMAQKVAEMLALAQRHDRLEIVIANGQRPEILADLLLRDANAGTRISADRADPGQPG